MQNRSHISIVLMDTDHDGLPDDWGYQLLRAYSILSPERQEFGIKEWTEKLHPRDKYGKWREVLARLVRRNDEQRATIGDDGATSGDPGGKGSGRKAASPEAGGKTGLVHQGLHRQRPVVNGKEVKTVRALPKHGREEKLNADGIPTPQLYEIDPSEAGTFRDMMSKIKKDPNGAAVTVYPEEEYAGMRLFMNEDGTTGFALRDDELVSVYNLPDGPRRVGRHLTASAIDQGARWADAYDTRLPYIYGPEGLHPVARMPFDDEYKPEDWDYENFKKWNKGKPDVIFMGFDPDKVDEPYEPGTGEMVDDYDLGQQKAREAARRAKRR